MNITTYMPLYSGLWFDIKRGVFIVKENCQSCISRDGLALKEKQTQLHRHFGLYDSEDCEKQLPETPKIIK